MLMCPITLKDCPAAYVNGEVCANQASLNEAVNCINSLCKMIEDMSEEISALDDLLERYKDGKKPN